MTGKNEEISKHLDKTTAMSKRLIHRRTTSWNNCQTKALEESVLPGIIAITPLTSKHICGVGVNVAVGEGEGVDVDEGFGAVVACAACVKHFWSRESESGFQDHFSRKFTW